MCKEMIEEVEACYAKYAPNRTFTITSDLDALDGVDVIVTEEWRYINPECGEEVLDPDDYNSWLGDAESLYPYPRHQRAVQAHQQPRHLLHA